MEMRAHQLGAMRVDSEERLQSVSEEERDAAAALAEVPPAHVVETATGKRLAIVDPVRQAVFLQALAEKPIVGRAAKAAGLTVGQVYQKRKRDRAFAVAWDEAVVHGVDTLEDVAVDRAIEKSDKLLEMLLKGLRPERYREKVDVAVAGQVEIVVDLVPGDFVPRIEDPGDVVEVIEAEAVEEIGD